MCSVQLRARVGAILTFLGGFHQAVAVADGYGSPSLAIAVIFIIAGHQYHTTEIGHSIKEMLNAKTSLALRLKAS